VLFVHPRVTAAIKTQLSRIYLELLSCKLVALLLDLSFEPVEVHRHGYLNRIFQQRLQVDLLEDDRILAKLLGYELVALFEPHLLQEVAGQPHPSTIVYFGKLHLNFLLT